MLCVLAHVGSRPRFCRKVLVGRLTSYRTDGRVILAFHVVLLTLVAASVELVGCSPAARHASVRQSEIKEKGIMSHRVSVGVVGTSGYADFIHLPAV